jgi:uncharacterized protein (TIGR02246 family)
VLSADEQAIRELVNKWQCATASGDLNLLLSMMAEDVVFLAPGQFPLRGKDSFADAFRAAWDHLGIDARSEIQEIRVSGSMAYCWNHFTVVITSLRGEPPRRRTGYTLTILRKTRSGAWIITRDANLLTADPGRG